MTSLFSKLAAVALLVLVAGGLAFGVAAPLLSEHARLTDEVATARLQLAAFAATPSTTPPPPRGAALEARNAMLAAVAIQRRIDQAVEDAGGERLTVRTGEPEPVDGALRIGVTVEAELDARGLRDVLHAVETGRGPTLFVDQLDITVARGAAAEDAPTRLVARMTVSGLSKIE